MPSRMYSQEQLQSISENLTKLPAQKQNLVEKKVALKKLTKQIKELHIKKHYNYKEIVVILKENGITTTQREIKSILNITPRTKVAQNLKKTTVKKEVLIKKNIVKLDKKKPEILQSKTIVKKR